MFINVQHLSYEDILYHYNYVLLYCHSLSVYIPQGVKLLDNCINRHLKRPTKDFINDLLNAYILLIIPK